MEEILYRFNPWWEGENRCELIPRPGYLRKMKELLPGKEIVILTGLRRIGKTSLLKLFIDILLTQHKISARYIFYVSIDFYLFNNLTIHDIITEYRKLHRITMQEKVYLFLDEITYKDNFQQELKNLYDLENVKLYISSSSTSILRDKTALMTGRTRVIEVLPLNFDEFLLFQNVQIKKSELYLLDKYFDDYMYYGGMPEFVLNKDIGYLNELLDNIIYKDIIATHNLRNSQVVRDFFRLLMERMGKQISLNKIAKILGISVDTARRYLSYFQEVYLVYVVEKCGKLNEKVKSPAKVYCADVSFKNIITGFRDKGAIFENLVYLLIKQKKPCYVYQNGIEIDFMTEDHELIEVKYHAEMNQKQQQLFTSIDARKKMIVNGPADYMKLLQ